MKFRKFLCCVICLCICVSMIDMPVRSAHAEDAQYIYEDGYTIRINPDGTRTITVTTSLDDEATPVRRLMKSAAPLKAAAPAPADEVQVNVEASSVSIETDDFGIFFSPSVSENPAQVTNADETINEESESNDENDVTENVPASEENGTEENIVTENNSADETGSGSNEEYREPEAASDETADNGGSIIMARTASGRNAESVRRPERSHRAGIITEKKTSVGRGMTVRLSTGSNASDEENDLIAEPDAAQMPDGIEDSICDTVEEIITETIEDNNTVTEEDMDLFTEDECVPGEDAEAAENEETVDGENLTDDIGEEYSAEESEEDNEAQETEDDPSEDSQDENSKANDCTDTDTEPEEITEEDPEDSTDESEQDAESEEPADENVESAEETDPENPVTDIEKDTADEEESSDEDTGEPVETEEAEETDETVEAEGEGRADEVSEDTEEEIAEDDEEPAENAEETDRGTDNTETKPAVSDDGKPNSKVRYTKLSNGVKEEVEIASYRGGHAVSYDMHFTGLTPVASGKEFTLVDDSGAQKGTISAPYMYDASGEKSTDISVSISDLGGGHYVLMYIPSDSWLSDESRVYPVVIDPTVIIQGATQGEDNYVTDGDSSGENYQYNADYLYVGNMNGYNYVTYIQPRIPEILNQKRDSIIIVDAFLTVQVAETVGDQTYTLHLVTGGSWSSQTITGDNSPAYSGQVYQSGHLNQGSNTWNIKGIFSAWYNSLDQQGTFGFVLKGDGTQNSFAKIKSSDYMNASYNAERVKISVTYEEVQGDPGLTAQAHGNGAGSGTGYVDLSWNPVKNAEGYYVGIFNGQDYDYIFLGDVTSYSTKGKGLWPTSSEISSGRYKLHTDGTGSELPAIPAFTYANVSGGSYGSDISYYFRVVPANNMMQAVKPDLYKGVSVTLPDTVSPNRPAAVTIDPADYTNLNEAIVSWTGIMDYNGSTVLSGSLGEGGRVEYSIDTTSGWQSTGKNSATGSFALDISACEDGQHAVYLRGVDASGNAGAFLGASFYIDRTGPVFAQLDIMPDEWANTDRIEVSWSGLTERGEIAAIEYSIDNGAWTDTGKTASDYTNLEFDVSTLTDGEHVFALRAADDLGNTGETVRGSFLIDRTAPVLDSMKVEPDGWTNAEEVTVSWSDALDAASGIAGFEYKTDNGNWTSIAQTDSTGSCAADISALTDGSHELSLRALDFAGNKSEAKRASVLIDRKAPEALILSPAAGTLADGTVSITGSISDTLLSGWTLTAAGADSNETVLASGTDAAYNAVLGEIDLSGYANGENIKLTLTVRDAAGNETKDTVTVVSFKGLVSDFDTDITLNVPAVIGTAQGTGTYSGPSVLTDCMLYIDGQASETVSGGEFMIYAARYAEDSVHTVSMIGTGTDGKTHYSGGLSMLILADEFYENGSPDKDGVYTISGLTAPGKMLALRLEATDYAPADGSVSYEYSLDGNEWHVIMPGSDVLPDTPPESVSLRVKLTDGAAEEASVYQICFSGIIEAEPASFRSRLLDSADTFALSVPETIAEAITTVGLPVSETADAGLYIDGKAQDTSVIDALLYEEGSEIAVSAAAIDADILSVSGGSMALLLREDKNGAAGTVLSGPVSCSTVSAIRLKAAVRGEGKFYISYDGASWTEIPNGDYFLLPETPDTLYLKAEMADGASLMGWHLEGAAAEEKTAKIALIKPVEKLTVNDYGAFSNKRYELKWSDGNTDDTTGEYHTYYVIYRDGERIAVTDQKNYTDKDYTAGAVYEVSAVREYADPGDGAERFLVRESDAATGKATKVKPSAPKQETQVTVETDGQDPLLASLYGGDCTFVKGEEAPQANKELDEKLLGKTHFCSLGLEPINFNTGNFYLETEDFSLADLGSTRLSLLRTYNTQSDTTDGVFGEKWTSEYSSFLQIYNDGTIAFREAGGARYLFAPEGDGYSAVSGYAYTLKKTDDGYRLTDGEKTYVFDKIGLLNAIEQNGLSVGIVRDETTHVMKSIVLPSGLEIGFIADDLGHVTAVQLPDGNKLSYEYEGSRLTSFTDASGRTTRYIYDEEGLMTEWYDAAGNCQVYNVYDDEDRVTYQEDAMGGKYTLNYTDHYTEVTGENGNSYGFRYDDQGRTVLETAPNGAETAYAYNASGYIASQTDALGRVTSYEYDTHGNKVRAIAPDGADCRFEYDANDRLTAKYDQNGNRTAYEYDENGNLTRTTFADGSSEMREYDASGLMLSFTDTLGNVTRYEYDGVNPVSITDALGHETAIEYDALNRVTATVNALGERTEYSYDESGNLTAVRFADGAEVSYAYDAMGNCVCVTDALGNETTFEYDALGNQTAGIDAEGSRSEIRYTVEGLTASVTDALGNTVSYAYDANGNLISETDAMGNVTRYEYDILDRTVREISPSGGETTYEYDPVTGLVTATTDATGARNAFEYDAAGNLTARIFPNGGRLENRYDSMNRLVEQKDLNGGITRMEYDALGRVIRVTDPMGAESRYTYDALGNLIAFTDALGNRTEYEYDALNRQTVVVSANGARTEYAYDTAGNLILTVDALGNRTEYAYNANGAAIRAMNALGSSVIADYNALGQVTEETQPNGGKVLYAYDALGRVTAQTDALGGSIRYAYDALGNVLSVTDALDQRANFTYDAMGNLTGIEWPDGAKAGYEYSAGGLLLSETDETGRTVRYAYDSMNNIASASVEGSVTGYGYDLNGNVISVTDAEGNRAEFRYDLMNRMTAVIYADGSRDSYTYDALGRLTAETARTGVTTSYRYDAMGNVLSVSDGSTTVNYEYDLLNRVTAIVTADGRTEYAYDAAGNVISVTDALANTTLYEYNESSELTAVQYANGARVEAGYDLNGNAVSETDAMGNETLYAYDAADRLIAVTDALGNTTRYEYDLRDNISAVTDALGHTVRYAYDAAGRLNSETDALGNVTAYEYTKEGYLSRVTKPDGGTVSYTYDKNGELTEESYSDGRVVGYEYNELGRLTVTEGAEGRTEYQYDGRGYLVSILYPNGEKVGYEYDDRGSRTALIYPDGNKVSYGYDALGRMTSVTGLDGNITHYEYDALGRRTLTAGGSLTTEYEYDDVGSVVRMATNGDTNVELLYGYDLNGMLTRETRRENGADTVSEYAYDALNRIASFSNGNATEAYSYDAAGNMLEKLTNGTAITMTYDAANRMTGMESVNGSIAYTYSASGDLISKTMGELRDTYTYDVAGNLSSYTGYDGYTVDYAYSALNILTEKVSTGNDNRATLEEIVSGKGSANTTSNNETITTRYTYDILQTYANVLTETVDDETTAYEYGLERIAAYTGTDAEQMKTQYVYDVRGSVIETVTAKAQRDLSEATAAPTVTVQGYAYTPYGEQIGSKVSGYTYNGEYYDAAAGMLNLRARRYEPALMRFSRPDIVRGYAVNPQSVNRYAYCINNPVMYADPSGMVFETVKNLWNAAKESTVGKFINEKIVQPVRKTVSACVDAVTNAARNVERAARNEIKIIAEAQAEISRLDKYSATYEIDKQRILQRACRQVLRYSLDGATWDGESVVFDSKGGYGANQGDLINNKSGTDWWLFRAGGDDKLFDFVKQYPGYEKASKKEIAELYERINQEGCGYVAVVNSIFAEYEKYEDEFEEKFGFTYYDSSKEPNYNRLLLDLYITTDDKYYLDDEIGKLALEIELVKPYIDKPDEFEKLYGIRLLDDNGLINVAAMDEALKIFNPKSGVVTKEKEEGTTIFELESRARNYLIAKGIEPSIRDSAFVDWSVNNVKTAITKGEVVSVLCDGFYLYNGNGNLASKEKIPGHWMVITDVTENGDYIVSSWAGRYLLKPSEINNLEYISINIK